MILRLQFYEGFIDLQIITQKVRSERKLLTLFVTTCRKSGAYEFRDEQIEDVAKHFIRKYTNARIAGEIKGREQSLAEAKGYRGKGGASLRDKLYCVSADKQPAGKKQKPKQQH